MSIEILTFFPGTEIKEWGNKAELMISSQVRIGPADPSLRFVNMLVFGYRFKDHKPIQNWGGHILGDSMIYYTPSYAGEKIGLTLHGAEIDKIKEEYWKGAKSVLNRLGNLALFTSAAPYLSLVGIAANFAQKLMKAINRNDRISMFVKDLYPDQPDRDILQSGRYLFWSDQAVGRSKMAEEYNLTGVENINFGPNILVNKSNNQPYQESPYFVVKMDSKKTEGYDDFEIGAKSAEILEMWGDPSLESELFDLVPSLGESINDRKRLNEISELMDQLRIASTDEEKSRIKEKIDARSKLFSDTNSTLMRDLLKNVLS